MPEKPTDAQIIARLRDEVTYLNQCLRNKNLALDALHYIWCDGGCKSGLHRWEDGEITEELVESAEANTKRLRTWLENNKFRGSRER